MKKSDQIKALNKLNNLLNEIDDYLVDSRQAAEAVSPDRGLGRLSRMEAMQDQQMVLELRRRQKRRKLEIINAISRLEEGRYGSCIFCNELISVDRLDAFPEVQTCVRCA